VKVISLIELKKVITKAKRATAEIKVRVNLEAKVKVKVKIREEIPAIQTRKTNLSCLEKN
jgi:hypothetical protein